MNYAELVESIQATTENRESTFVTQIPFFVKMAEKEIYNFAQLPAVRFNKTGAATAFNKYLTTPTDFLSPFSMAVVTNNTTGEQEFLLNKDVNYIREAYANPSSYGRPKVYAIFDSNTFILAPTPDAAYTMELHYFGYPTSIVTASTTFIGDNYEKALLYASLKHAYIFMKGEQDVVAYYDGQFKEAINDVKRLGDGLDRRDAYRSGQVRLDVK